MWNSKYCRKLTIKHLVILWNILLTDKYIYVYHRYVYWIICWTHRGHNRNLENGTEYVHCKHATDRKHNKLSPLPMLICHQNWQPRFWKFNTVHYSRIYSYHLTFSQKNYLTRYMYVHVKIKLNYGSTSRVNFVHTCIN